MLILLKICCHGRIQASVDNPVRIFGSDEKARESLAQYIAICPISLEKITYEKFHGRVLFKTPKYNDYFKENFRVFDALEFIALITSHIPPKHKQLIRRYGLYAYRSRGKVDEIKFENHIVICGWNNLCPDLINNLLSQKSYIDVIIVLANIPEVPLELQRIIIKTDKIVEFILGNPRDENDLRKTNIEKSKSTIIVPNTDSSSSDIILICSAIESIDPDICTTAIIMDTNTKNIINALSSKFNIDEIICVDDLASSITVNTSVNQGLSKIINALCDFNKGNNFYKIEYKEIPDYIKEMKYKELVCELISKGITLLASEKVDKNVIMNPSIEYVLEEGANIFVVSEDKAFSG